MFFTVDQLVAHAVGDYLTQSHWMATTKTKQWFSAAIHVLLYGIPFLFITRSIPALAVIIGTHFIIDHWRLARHVIWLKNCIGPWKIQTFRSEPGSHGTTILTRRLRPVNPPWRECKETGFPPDTPPWLAVWLLIIVDNLMHILINGAALHWLA